MGSIITAKKGTKLSIMVKPFVTISTDAIKHLPVPVRFCFFPDEKQLSVSKSYTQKSCLIECRLNYLHEKCHCRPYYFNMIGKYLIYESYIIRQISWLEYIVKSRFNYYSYYLYKIVELFKMYLKRRREPDF